MKSFVRSHGRVIACLAAMVALTALPAFAQTNQQFDWCVNKDNAFSPDLQIKGCTALIKSGRGTVEMLEAFTMQLALAYMNKEDYDAAIATYTVAIALQPKDAFAYLKRGSLYASKKNDPDRAIADFTKAIALNPKDPLAFLARGITNYLKGDYNSAIADCDHWILLDPNNAKAYYYRGLAKQKLGDKAGGDEDIVHARQLNPKIDE